MPAELHDGPAGSQRQGLTCILKGGDWLRHKVGEMVTISPSGVACCVVMPSKAASTCVRHSHRNQKAY